LCLLDAEVREIEMPTQKNHRIVLASRPSGEPKDEDFRLEEADIPSLTSYCGLLKFGQPKPGETVVVGAAAGAVGSVVGEIAKIKDCRAVGIAGGTAKCDYLVSELGFDACVDRRGEQVAEELARACPKGIDVYFENIGGPVFHAVLPLMNLFGRIPVCGLIAHYNATSLAGPNRVPVLMRVILSKRLSVRGFIVSDFMEGRLQFEKQMSQWLRESKVKYREDVVDGLENAVAAFQSLWHGQNFGKLLVRGPRAATRPPSPKCSWPTGAFEGFWAECPAAEIRDYPRLGNLAA
jgi:NADPH-dependent curcumin reductase CurA